ncbi:hypothetical protein CBR_g28645 [Chara braunii]|uniref:Integrase zinc-binding domain-containing protein n=1 Tax=Chara braunii TaxID=69332 RepID=A0A388L9E1_CHABU|nr:hypothetical protein CBR_g28645 [Chara braunii]|eukprot:GBG78929.1 hypothetical protein CBR_g28645 [Chara braunii]
MPEEMADGGRKLVTLGDLIDALDKRERAPNNVPKVDNFHFKEQRVSDLLDLTEQALVGLSDEVNLQRVLRYVLHSHHQEVGKVVDAANGSWARFGDMMQRKYRLGDGLLTMADLEAMNKDDFSTIGAFVHEFKRKARKVHGISEETKCAIFLGLLTSSEASELTGHGGGNEKLTWATIDKGVEEGNLDQVEQHQVQLQRRKRKERDATTSGTPGVKRIVTDVLAALGYDNEAEVQKRGVTVAQGRTSGAVEEEARREDYGREETGSLILTKAQRKQRNLQVGGQGSGKGQVSQAIAATPPAATTTSATVGLSCMGSPSACGHWASQASVAGGGNQGQGGQGNGGRGQGGRGGGGRGWGENGGGRGGGWNGQRGQNQGGRGGQEGGQGYGRPRFDWRNATYWHCGDVGHTVRFCERRREDELSGLISFCMDGDIYDKWGEHINPRTPGGIRQKALRQAAAGPTAPPTMFSMWPEKEEPTVRVEEIVGDSEEITQRLKAGTVREEPIVVESDDEGQESEGEPAIVLLGRMEDLLEKVGRYQRKLQTLCEEAREWEANLPEVFLYDSGPEPSSGQQGYPRVATVGTGPRSGMAYRPPTPHGRVPQAAQTRSQNKAGPSQEPSQAPPRKEPEPGRRKEVVEVPEEEEEDDDEEDERLRQEEDQRAELRARKRGAREEAEPSLPDNVPKRKKYEVRMEEDFDVERMVDKLLEGHNDLMNLKDILASAPRLRGELKGRLSRRLVPNVHLSTVLPREVEWTEAWTRMDWKCVACGQVDLVIRNQKCTGMVDTGAKMNIIREKEAVMIGMEIDCSDHGMMHGANCKAAFCGTTSNVIIEIGKVRARTCFFVMPDVDHPILLGRSFLCRTETLIFNKHDGTMILLLCDPLCGNYEVITCRNTGPGSGRNRPNLGSFTFEESENERRRLWEVPEEEDRPEVLTLSLTNMNKAMEVVSAHDMADPEAIKALREQVLENPQDLQRLNAVTMRDAGGLPNADALSESCSGRPIISLIDLYSGYDQFPVYPPDRPVTAMHTPRGLIHMNGAPQGWTNAVAMVQRHMIKAMQMASPHITQPYIDDLSVKGPKEKGEDEVMPGVRRFVWKHVQDIDQVLGLLEEHNLTASGPKSKHCMREATILGFVCNKNGRRPDVKKTYKILEWPVPFRSITDVRSFLGTCGFWRNFVRGFATKTEHLRKLVRQDQEWVWGEDQEEAVGRMKGEFKEGGLVLGAPNYEATEERPFVIETDAGPTALGGVLIQKDTEGKERPLRFERTHNLVEEMRTIEEGSTQVEEHEQLMGGMYLLTNTLLQGDFDRKGSFSHEGNEILVPESRDDEFEEGEIKEAFWAEEYDGIYRELGLLLSCEMRDRDASAKEQKMRHLYVVRDDHLFIKRQVGNPKRIVCGRNRQIDIIAALHDGIAGGHRGVGATCAKISELYYWDGMLTMVIKYCRSCGLPIRLEEGNAEEFILAYEQYMRDQGTGQEEWMQTLPLWTQSPLDAEGGKAVGEADPRQGSRLGGLPGPAETGISTTGARETRAQGGETTEELEAHLDASQWRASQLGADQSGPARYEPVEDEPVEEPPEPRPEGGSRGPEEPQTEGVITVGDDTPPPAPILEQAGPEEGEWARTPTTVAPQLTEPTGERMDAEVPTSGEPPPGPPPAEEEASERDPLREVHEARTGRPPGEMKEEKSARVQVRLEELYQEKLRMEVAGEAPKSPIDPPTSEQRISEAWASYESERDAARLRLREVGQESARVDEARETEDLGFSASRMEIERADRRIGEVAISSFQRYSLLSDELAASRLEVGQLSTQLAEKRAENQAWRSRMEAKEAEWEKRLQDMAAIGEQGKEVQGLFDQEGTTETPQQEGMGKVFVDPTEAAARREAEERRFSFRTPTEFAPQQATAMTIEVPGDEPAQRPQPLVAEGGPTEESPMILLEVQEGVLTGAAASTEPEVMGGEASRLDELVAAMELDMPSRGPQRQETPERVPEIGELRTQLGSWATGAGSGEHISEQQQEVMSESATAVISQPFNLHRDEGATLQRTDPKEMRC